MSVYDVKVEWKKREMASNAGKSEEKAKAYHGSEKPPSTHPCHSAKLHSALISQI